MRTLGYSTVLLAASLVVAPACQKDEKKPEGETDKAADAGKAEDKKTDGAKEVAKPVEDKPKVEAPTEGVAGVAGGTAALAAGGFPASIGLVPDQAQFVLGLSPKTITSSPLWAMITPELDKDQEFQKALSAFKDCGIDATKLDSLVVGISLTRDFSSGDFVAVMVGEGIGEDANASCVIKNIQGLAGDAQVADVVTTDGKKMIQFTDGRAYLVDGRTLAIATTAWEGPVGELIDGKGTPASSNSKKDLFAKVNATASIWGVATIPVELAQMAPLLGAPAEFGSVQSVTGSVDLTNGAAFNMLAAFSTAEQATSVETQLKTLMMLATADAPPEMANVVKTIKIAVSGNDLTIAMAATMDDIAKANAANPTAPVPPL